MGVTGLSVVKSVLKVFKASGSISDLKRVATGLKTTCGLTLRLGNRTLHEASSGQVEESLRSADLTPKSLSLILEKIVDWHQDNEPLAAWEFDVLDLRAVAARNVNLGRDLDLLAETNQLLKKATECELLEINVTLAGQKLTAFGASAGRKAELLVGLRALLSPLGLPISYLTAKMDSINLEGKYPVEDHRVWP
ncbi:MAG: hypothetical protein WC529_00630 [Candidatus Margulisiibacteriota bacterium]